MDKVNGKNIFVKRERESGSISIEFLLLVPTLAFIVMFLLGLYVLEKKHQALVAARFSAQFQTVYSRDPSSSTIGKAVGDPDGRWMLNNLRTEADSTSQGKLKGEIQNNDGLGFAGVFAGILNFLGGNNKLEYTASSNTFGGFIAKSFRLNSVQATYVVESDTWTCDDGNGNDRGSYLSILVNTIPFVGQYIDSFFDLSCCETYESTKDNVQ